MSDDPEFQTAIRRRGTLGLLLLVVPIVSIVLVFVGYGVMWTYGLAGRAPTGDTVRIAFHGCADAAPIVDRRLAAMGLERLGGAVDTDGFDVVTRLPDDPHARAFLPGVLALEGRFEVRAQPEDKVLATEADVAESAPEMRFLDAPHARVRLKPEAATRLTEWQKTHMEGHVQVRVDGVKVADWQNMPAIESADLEVDQVDATTRDRIDLAAAVPIVLGDGPLPCPVTLAGVTSEPPQ
jgi:hypothetical protein